MSKFLVSLILLTTNLYANGSPIDQSAFKKAGQIEPKQISDVSLINEELSAKVQKDWVQVRVVYTLSGPKRGQTIAYGFPVHTEAVYTENPAEGENEYECVRGVSFSLNGDRLPHTIRFKPGKNTGTIWALTSLPLKKGVQATLQVDYLVRSDLDDELFTKSFKPKFGERVFTYSFRLAKNWAPSKPNIKATVDVSQVLLEGGKLVAAKPTNSMTPNGILTWTWNNAELASMEDLVIKYDRSDALFREYIEAGRDFIGEWKLEGRRDEPAAYKFSVPDSISPNHSWTHLFDRSFRKAYATKWTGQPRKISLKSPSVHGLGILNGYLRDESTYTENARIKAGYFELETPGFTKMFPESEDLKKADRRNFQVPDRAWKDFNPLEPWRSLDWIVDIGDVPGPMNINIVITEVYPGTKYQDLCLSEMFLVK